MFKGLKWTAVLLSAVCIICGIVLLFNPVATARAIFKIVGIVALISGIMHLVENFTDGNPTTPTRPQLTRGLLDIVAALVLTFMTGTVLSIINIAVGLILVVYCVFAIQSSLDSKALQHPYWWASFTAAVVGIVLGIIMVFGGISATNVVIRLGGIALMVYGFEQLWSVFVLFGDR